MSRKTVFVIGAGASAEFELPTGNELKTEISNILKIDQDDFGGIQKCDNKLYSALEFHAREKRETLIRYIQASNLISKALPLAISIDHFINAHRNKEEIAFCGKLAITRSILQAEKRSLLYIDTNKTELKLTFEKLKKTWLQSFFQIITENCSLEDLKERFKSIKLVIFNYDRCVEHFLYYAIQNYYDVTKIQAAELINSLEIYHPYGSVGFLPWSRKTNLIKYGADINPRQLIQTATMIKTFTEGTDSISSEVDEIRCHIKDSQRIVFLGFAFHSLNMDLLNPRIEHLDLTDPRIVNRSTLAHSKKCFGTSHEISDSDKEIISSQLNTIFDNRIDVKLINKTCYEFFDEFRRSLSFV
jgi:hypothetical protein